jgi:hypothetical protein
MTIKITIAVERKLKTTVDHLILFFIFFLISPTKDGNI